MVQPYHHCFIMLRTIATKRWMSWQCRSPELLDEELLEYNPETTYIASLKQDVMDYHNRREGYLTMEGLLTVQMWSI